MSKILSHHRTILVVFLACAAIVVSPVTQLSAHIILPDLPEDAKYQLVFVTSDVMSVNSGGNIDVYNTFATNQAAPLTALFPTLPEPPTWRAVLSTTSTAATANAVIYGNMPIYNTHGQLVATGYSQFWSASHSNPINYDQNGNLSERAVWTGTYVDGEVLYPLGAPPSAYGESSRADWQWSWHGTSYGSMSIYALSSPVPEPGTLVLLGMGAFALAFYGWRWIKHEG